jgi:ATP-dependent Clp protease ATP-binding subunit ClpA
MFERFTDAARQVVTLAQEEARRMRHDHIGSEHVLLGLLGQRESLSARLLGEHGLDYKEAHAAVVRIAGTPAAGGLDADALETIGIDLSAVRERVEAVFGPGALDRDPHRNHQGVLVSGRRVPFSPRSKKILELALREAIALKSRDIRDGHVLLGLIREGEGLGVRIMTDTGIDLPGLRVEIRSHLS